MAIAFTNRRIDITMQGDVNLNYSTVVTQHTEITSESFFVNLSTNSPIGIPLGASLTIIPQAGNVNAINLKGNPTDTGIRIHNTDPTIYSPDPTQSVIYLSCPAGTLALLIYS